MLGQITIAQMLCNTLHIHLVRWLCSKIFLEKNQNSEQFLASWKKFIAVIYQHPVNQSLITPTTVLFGNKIDELSRSITSRWTDHSSRARCWVYFDEQHNIGCCGWDFIFRLLKMDLYINGVSSSEDHIWIWLCAPISGIAGGLFWDSLLKTLVPGGLWMWTRQIILWLFYDLGAWCLK